MANLIVVCGPQAVGKMVVAESLRDKLKYNLMINHDSIEVSDRIFGFATPAMREFNENFREKAFELFKLNTDEGEFLFENHLKIDNTDLTPDEVADRVIKEYSLTPDEKEDKEYRFGV